LFLAWRYLNPRRATLSLVTLISLAGVALGVLVLVVVLAVMSGLEHEIKSRLLGFTPHVLVEFAPGGGNGEAPTNWRDIVDAARDLDGVESVTPFVQDNVILDFQGVQSPVVFRAIDTEDPTQVEGVAKMLYLDRYPDSTADMGLDNRAVVSSIVAEQFGLRPGDMLKLWSTRNLREVMHSYKITDRPPVREEFADELQAMRKVLAEKWQTSADGESVDGDTLDPVYEGLRRVFNESIRPPEAEMIGDILETLQSGEWDDAKKTLKLPNGTAKEIGTRLDELESLDIDAMDARILRGLREIVLPKEVEVVGIYQASRHVLTPDLFLPLPLGQNLVGLGDGVQGVALRVKDPYHAGVERDLVAAALSEKGFYGWRVKTWMEQYESWFSLIARERVMMYFVLSFIFVISAFSMGAVMLAVTVQKRTEIGVMKALGATPGQIGRVFLYQGIVVGFCGSLLGVLLGRIVIHFRKPIHAFMRDALHFDPFPSSFHGFEIPAQINPVEHFWICVGALVLCSLAALLPAIPAARCDAAKSLRNL
jgi:lipoprotein-releasing system permease protein